MQNRTGLGLKWDKLYVYSKVAKRIFRRSRYARKRIQMIGGGYRGSRKEFRETVLPFWKPYGVRPARYWYTLYCAESAYDPRYLPDNIWYGKILPYFNNLIANNSYVDKNFFDTLFADLKRPKTVVKNIAGHYYDGDMQLLSEEEAIRRCVETGHWVIKPSTNNGGGQGVRFFDASGDGDTEKIRALFREYQFNFIVQELVQQHPDLARIHEKSVNTVRVQSFFFHDEIHILNAQLRMGGGDSRVDNVSSGGCSCVIGEGGWLVGKAVTRKSEWTDRHESGIYFKDICVPSYDKILEIIRRKHKQLPFFGIIGWDFAVDASGEPVFIEMNCECEPNQIASGPTFGDLTADVLKEVFIDKRIDGCFL